MSKFKALTEEVVYNRKTKTYTIEVDDLEKGKTIAIEKWWIIDGINGEYDCDWGFRTDDDQKWFDAQSEDVRDEFQEFVDELKN